MDQNNAQPAAPSAAVFLFAHMTVKDAAKLAEYGAKIAASLEQWGGQVIFHGRKAAVLSGRQDHTHVVVYRFPDTEAVDRWYSSPAYQALTPLRDQAIVGERVLVTYQS